MTIEDDIAFLQGVPALAILGRDALRILAIGTENRYVHEGVTLFGEGEQADGAYVVQEGSFDLVKRDNGAATVVGPGALIGEVSLLLDSAHTATVNATERCVVRHAADGNALLSSHPDITRLVAVGLAERLHFVTTYLADLKHQYGDVPGLAMVSDVLSELAQRQAPPARPGSAREPDPDY